MDELVVLLQRVMEVIDRFRTMQQRIPGGALLVFGVLAVFGLLNCLLGYRLMRFWMMLFGFFAGAGISFAAAWFMDVPTQDKRTYLIAMLSAGASVAVITFLFYRAGVFLMAAVLGIAVSIYLVHPTTSATFFVCLLIGVLLGFGSFKYDREVIIVMTGIFGGTLAGYSLARILHLEEIPYGALLCAGLSLAGMAIQFAANRRTPPGEPAAEAGPEGEKWLSGMNGEEEGPEESPVEFERRMRQENEEFYEQYFQGADVFDREEEPPARLNEEKQNKKRTAAGFL